MSLIVARPTGSSTPGSITPPPSYPGKGTYVLHSVNTSDSYVKATHDPTTPIHMADNSTWAFSLTAVAMRVDAADGRAGYKIEGVIYRHVGPGTTAFQGKPLKTVLAESNPDWDINIDIDYNTGTIGCSTLGQVGKTIRWLITLDTTEIKG